MGFKVWIAGLIILDASEPVDDLVHRPLYSSLLIS